MSEKTESLVDQLIRGSAEINCLKSEIQTVVGVVKGVLSPNKKLIRAGLEIECGSGSNCHWAVLVISSVVVRLHRGEFEIYSSDWGVAVQDVEQVHECLVYLVQGLKDRLPEFENLIRPYTSAAHRAPGQ